MKSNTFYPLVIKNLNDKDISAGIKTLKTGNITMGQRTIKLESIFKNKITNRESIMVNSGSSANLLIFQCLINPKVRLLNSGDEVLIPAICWSTSLWPIIQSGLKPIFVDIDKDTLNICTNDLCKKITKKTKALMLVHVLGNSADMSKIIKICKKNKLILIEDACEALGSKYKNKQLGTFGDFSSYSMFYSHHITSGEGGIVSVKNKKYSNIVKILRSHGWSRELGKAKDSWEFINSGFNLRPTDINASIGINQLSNLNKIINIRKFNYKLLFNVLTRHNKFSNQFKIIKNTPGVKACWFGMAIKLNKNLSQKKKVIQKKLKENGIETRPIISGNFARQKGVALYKIKSSKLTNADYIDKSSFFIGIHNKKLLTKTAKRFADKFFEAI
jgi:dTDP-4-amino-4,6-dideoxygalactose transaminase